MNRVTHIVSGDEMQIRIPYALKEAFRDVFKTASWDPAKKHWVVRNTTANLNKLKRFIESTQGALSALDHLETLEATVSDIQHLEKRVDEVKSKICAEVEKQAQAVSAMSSAALLSEQLNKLKQQYVAERAAAEQARRAANEERQRVKQELDELMQPFGIKELVSQLYKIRARGIGRRNRLEFEEVQLQIEQAYTAICETTGVSINALKSFSRVNFNRPDRDRLDNVHARLYDDVDVLPKAS